MTRNSFANAIARISGAQQALVIGMGGGGDVVGCLAVARVCESLGTPARLGGVAWERFPIDPYPGPRALEQIVGGRVIGGAAVLADAATTTPEGARFAESGMAEHTGEEVALIDVAGGVASAAAGITAVAEELGSDLVILADVGGDVLARGDEPGLASPLCDAIMLAAAARQPEGITTLLAVAGAGCDGELTPAEVLTRLAELARGGAWIGTFSVTAAMAGELDAAAGAVPTEASLQIVRCARGELGPAPIRGGRRTVELTPAGAMIFVLDPLLAMTAGGLPLAGAVAGARSIEEGREALAALGVRTELDYERDRARESA
ncbi:MAG: hypothetical protein QOJ01_1057 [Solirubrobacterales bacterium]|nr:hypothetical protein [Solirubrobacterales bacterium]